MAFSILDGAMAFGNGVMEADKKNTKENHLLPATFNKSWTNWNIKTETKKWKLGITNGIVYRPNQIVEETNFDPRTHT